MIKLEGKLFLDLTQLKLGQEYSEALANLLHSSVKEVIMDVLEQQAGVLGPLEVSISLDLACKSDLTLH